MMGLWFLWLLILTVAAKDYSGYRLLNVPIRSKDDSQRFHDIGLENSVDFLNSPRENHTTQVVVSPDDFLQFIDEIKNNGFTPTANIDLQNLIRQDSLSVYAGYRAWRPFKNLADIFSKFPRYTEMIRWMKQIVRDYPEIASFDSIGTTYDGKPTAILKIGMKSSKEKKVIWIDGAIHGREWISATTVLYIAYRVLDSYSAGNTKLLETYDWIFLPVANPDGYEYSHSTDRLWRKNRRPIVMGCYGVDLNRNFGVHWGVTKGSVSSQGCSPEYGGPGPFSEPETINMRNYMSTLEGRLETYLSFHSYSQLWLIPWGYTVSKPGDYSKQFCVANEAVKAARHVNGLDYNVGTLSDLLYVAAGGSFDWAKASGATYSFTVELRPTAEQVGMVVDRGFLAKVNDILPTGKEMWAAVTGMLETIHKGSCD